jgi:hypothetical protein
MQTALTGGTPDMVPTFLCYSGMYLNRHTTLEYFAEYLRRMGDRDRYPFDPQEDAELRRRAIKQTLDLFTGRVDYQFGFPNIRAVECQDLTRAYIDLVVRYVDAESVRVYDDGSGPSVDGVRPHGNWDRTAKLDTEADVDRHFEPRPSASPSPKRTEQDPFADLRVLHKEAISELSRVAGFTTPFASAIGAFSYQGAMMAVHDKPKVFAHFIERAVEQRLKAVGSAGEADWFWFDEYYTDDISPEHYERYVFGPNVRIAKAIRESGKPCMYYFCGDIMSKLDKALQLEVDALAFEESKKWFRVDLAEVKKRVGHRKALVGNMDGMHLLPRGSREQVAEEAKRQLAAAASEGGFIMGAGSPIAPDTPTENMLTFLDTTRELGRYPMDWLEEA